MNPYHDPKNGQFTNARGNTSKSTLDKKNPDEYNITKTSNNNSTSYYKTETRLSPEQIEKIRNATLSAVAAVGISAGIYAAYKTNAIDKISNLIQSGNINGQTVKLAMQTALDEEYTVLKQGTIIHRMSAYANIDFSKVSAPMYASYKDKDVATYMTLLKDWSETGKRYDVSFEAIKDLKIPTREKAQKIFEKLWNEDESYRKQLKDTLVESYRAILRRGGITKATPGYIELLIKRDFGDSNFDKAMYSIVRKGEDSEKLIKEFVRQGFDALEDYFDKGTFSDSPIIVLDPSGSLRKTGEQFVDKALKLETLSRLPMNQILGGTYSVEDLKRLVEQGIL